MNIYDFCLEIVIVLAIIQPINGECNEFSGPSGVVECFSSSRYNGDYQWGTCLTKAYIEQRSEGNYSCEDSTRTYCYYQCMLEQYDVLQGPVNEDCSCRPGYALHSTEAPLPAWCYSPDGTECSWYRTCLEKRFPCTRAEAPNATYNGKKWEIPCSRSGASYAIDYGEKFCNLYNEHYEKFDEIGQKWIDAVRKCLQVALVPLLRPYNHPSCDDIKTTAFKSHSECYVSPYPGAPSFCDLSWKDYWQVLFTINSVLCTDFNATKDQGLATARSCLRKKIPTSPTLKFIFEAMVEIKKLEQSLTKYLKKTADLIENVLVYIFDDSNRRKRSADPSNSTVLNVLLFDRKKYDLNYNNVSNISIDGVITTLINDIERGHYQLNIGVPIEEISLCPDIECHNITRTVLPGSKKESTMKPGPEEESTGLAIGAIIGIVVGVIVGVIVLCALCFFFIRKR